MLDLPISSEEDEKQFRHLTKEIENISEKNKKISKNNQLRSLLGQIDLQEAQSCTVTEKKSYDSLQAQMGTHTQVAAGSQRLIEKLNKLGDVCPTCEQEVDPTFKQSLVHTEAEKVTKAEKEIERITEEIRRIKNDNKEFEQAQKLEADWKDLYRSIDKSLPSTLLDKQELESRLASVRAQLLERKSELENTAKELSLIHI